MEYKIVYQDQKFIIKEKNSKYDVDLKDRLFRFAVDTIKFLGTLPFKKEYDIFRYQLSRSATSMGANYEEAQGAFSKKEFASKIGICLKESKESNYFYRVIQALKIGEQSASARLVSESDELQKIFGSISKKVNLN